MFAVVGTARSDQRIDECTLLERSLLLINTYMCVTGIHLEHARSDWLPTRSVVRITGSDGLYGLAIKEDLDDYYETDVQHSRLYSNLDTLDEKGFVEKSEIDKRTNSYALTGRGQREIEARSEWEAQYVTA